MDDGQYWKFGRQETACMGLGALLGAAFGFGLFVLQPAPPWWFLPVRLGRKYSDTIDTWPIYEAQGGYESFWLQSTWGWALVFAVVGLVFSNVALRKKKL